MPVPNHLHVEWSVRALEAGKHVLCEKPLCLSATDVLTLIAARDRSGRHIEEAFSYRNHPQWAKIARAAGGAARSARRAPCTCTLAKQFLDPNDIRNNPDQGGGALYDLGSYTISACSAAFGRAPKRVIAAIDRDPAWKIDRLSTALLDYGDSHASFTVGTQSGPVGWATHQQFSVLGSNGWLRCDLPYAHGRPTACHLYVGDHTSHGSFETAKYDFEPVNQYTLQVERFSRYLRGEAVPSWPIEDSLTHAADHRGAVRVREERALGSYPRLTRGLSSRREQLRAHAAQPAHAGVVVVARMPVLLDRERRNPDRARKDFDGPRAGERFADRARNGRDQVGRRDDGRETQEARQLELHAALDALALQRALQHRIAGRRQDPDVRLVPCTPAP